jgi:hypothetical protein
MSNNLDRLYKLLPAVYRQRDADQQWQLRALLRVIAEQVDIVEQDIAQLYENWFIETCQDWVVPYIGDLVGYEVVHDAGEPVNVATAEGRQLDKILIPRRDVANTIRYRRRKGALALLDQLAHDVAGWPARAVEFYALLGVTQNINARHLGRGRTVDLRDGDDLDLLDSPFERLPHTVDVRRPVSQHSRGLYNIPSVGVFVCRLKTYPVTFTQAYNAERAGPQFFTFSVLGNDSPLYTSAIPEAQPTDIPGELNLPVPIRRRPFQDHKTRYYGEGKSLMIWRGVSQRDSTTHKQVIVPRPVEPHEIQVADLSDWRYIPDREHIAVDPVLGRIAFPPDRLPKGVWVSYYYGFSADIGGGAYNRPILQPAQVSPYQVGEAQNLFPTIQSALDQWKKDKEAAEDELESGETDEAGESKSKERRERMKAENPQLLHAVIEITDNRVYTEPLNIALEEHESLQIRAANGARPIIRLLDWRTNRPDSLNVSGESGSRFTLDGLLITGRGVQVDGNLAEVSIRHCTLVPGWELNSDCTPRRPAGASLELFNTSPLVVIEHSIIGSIEVNQDEARMDPVRIRISDSVLDATSPTLNALHGPGCPVAPAVLTFVRTTVFGLVKVHAIDLAENSIFYGLITVARRLEGCVRFCYVTPGSRTPRRYNCQPDLVEQAVDEDTSLTDTEKAAAKGREDDRVRPLFNSMRYGAPTYCQLADACADEIKGGADDESEMGVFHDLFQPQRAANLRARLDEYTPASMEAGIIYVS